MDRDESGYDWHRDETVSGQVPSVEHAIGVFDGQGNLYGRRWFRGQSRAEWGLHPAVLREGARAALITAAEQFGVARKLEEDRQALWAEAHLNREFRRRASSMLVEPRDPVEIYLAAQHHRLPTRLLDWTTNLLAALFFATASDPDADGKLFALTADQAASYPGPHGGSIQGPLSTHDPELRKSIESLFGEAPWESGFGGRPQSMPAGAIPVVPDLQAGRMFQQGACFTFHPPGVHGVPLAAPSVIIIPREAKPRFQATLRRIGISWGTLFPEPEFVARDLVEEFGLHAVGLRR